MRLGSLAHLVQPHLLLILVALASIATVVACGGASTPSPAEPAAQTAPTEKPVEPTPVPPTSVPTAIPEIAGQTFEFPLEPAWVANGKYQPMVLQGLTGFNPGQWDVQSCGGLPTCLQPSSMQFNGLVFHDPNDPIEIICDLCESWQVSPDGTVYTFTIRDAKWHDGEPVTATDIQYSMDRLVEPDAIRARTAAMRDFYEHKTAKVLDEKTVEIPIKFPGPLFLINLSSEYMKMYAKHATEDMTPDVANQAGNLLGSGPWKLKDFEPQVSIEYERNQDYFKPGRPFFDGLKFTVIRDYNRRLAALQQGQVFTTGGPNIGSYGNEDSLRLQQETDGRLRAVYIEDAVQTFLILHANKPPFDDPRVRKAVFLAIDRNELANIVRCREGMGCFGSPGTFFPRKGGFDIEPADTLGAVPGWRVPKDPDIAEAKLLMQEAGYEDGIKVTMNLSTSPNTVRTAEVVAEQLRGTIGIDLDLQQSDRASAVARIREGNHHISIDSSGVIITDPSDYLNQHFVIGTHKNPDGWTDDRLTPLIQAQAMERDPAKRLELFQQALEILREGQSQWVPTSWGYSGAIMDYRLQGYNVPESEQLTKHWEAIWWDPDVPQPPP